MADRREHRRMNKRVKVRFGEDELDRRGYGRDVSIGGMFLDCTPLPPLGTRLHMHVLDPVRDFYVEAEVVRQRRVPPQLRSVQKEGVGVRFFTPSELIMAAVAKEDRVRVTNRVFCADTQAVKRLLRDQVLSRILVVPVDEPVPAFGTVVEFTIELGFGTSTMIEGQGRVVQLIGKESEERSAVLEIQDAESVRTALETVVT